MLSLLATLQFSLTPIWFDAKCGYEPMYSYGRYWDTAGAEIDRLWMKHVRWCDVSEQYMQPQPRYTERRMTPKDLLRY